MLTKKIEKIVKKISERYGVEAYFHVEKIAKNKVLIRSELTLAEGGHALAYELKKLNESYICEPQGGCAYIVYKI